MAISEPKVRTPKAIIRLPRRVRAGDVVIATIIPPPTLTGSNGLGCQVTTCGGKWARVTGTHDGAIVRANQHVHVLAGVSKAPDHLSSSASVIQTFLQRHPRFLENLGLLATGCPHFLSHEITMGPHILKQDPTSHGAMICPSTATSQRKSKKLINTNSPPKKEGAPDCVVSP